MKFEWDLRELVNFANQLENTNHFAECMGEATQEIAKAMLKHIKSFTPVDTGELIQGWDGNSFVVTKKDN